jgi:hypothetical protein
MRHLHIQPVATNLSVIVFPHKNKMYTSVTEQTRQTSLKKEE